MKVEIIPSLSNYEVPLYPEDTREEWGSVKPKPKRNEETPEKKKVRFIYDDLRKKTLESLSEAKKETLPKPQEALQYSFPILPLLLAICGILVFIFVLRFFTRPATSAR
jgi:hypothetical protein